VTDTLEYHVTMEELVDGEWRPYTGTDVQVEFTMLDPHVRITLAHDGRGHYSTRFVAPDVYGVFQFKLAYNRVGYSFVRLADTVTVRPFRHNEYERFIAGAAPYYAGAFAVMGCFALLSFLLLAHREAPVSKVE
jgi:oligosaccharyltransferase complex subunit beta